MIKPTVKYCKSCTYPSSSAVPLEFDENGRCSGCSTNSEKKEIDWDRRKLLFESLIDEYKSNNYYDCIIPVSGGKDSYWQIHKIKEYGLNPLLVTYHGNNYTQTGLKNLKNMREVFNADHIFYTPNIDLLKRMNRVGQKLMGDMNWHNHAGIETYPIRVAVEKNIPLMIWGEHGFMDLGGMYSYKDLVEFTYRFRHEHALRGYEWYDIIKASIKSNDEIMIEKYGFKEAEIPFERTYWKMSNLDDMHENGIHDYMKWIKFGYGRATDHTSKDIRFGKITRKKALVEVLKRDCIKSQDLERWLSYVGWTEEYFDEIADTFRDPSVWWIKDNQWCKKDIDGVERSYGAIKINLQSRKKFFSE